MTILVPVLLAGGSGTRLWPTSRYSYPKQFIDLVESGDSMLQAALKRSSIMPNSAPWIIVTGEDYRFLVAQQSKEIAASVSSIMLEPVPRNTAPAIAIAALEALSLYDSPRLMVQTADHHIKDLSSLSPLIHQAFKGNNPFVLFGIQPKYAETGYGYIEYGVTAGHGAFVVSSFKEKPNIGTAQSYIDEGNYLWNSGMFMLDARAYLEALKAYEPEIFIECHKAFQEAKHDLDFKRIGLKNFKNCPSKSIDHAVMERLNNLCVIPYHGDWTDVGSWDSVEAALNADKNGNSCQGDTVLLDSTNMFVRSESRLVAGIGLNNLSIIETRDAVLVTDKSHAQKVKDLVCLLKDHERKEATEHQKVHRPWGSYETLILGDRFQVKQIVVNPGESLSLQMHHHRAEHWVVVSGIAEVTIGEKQKILKEDQSIYIPIGSVHRLRNSENSPLTLIEVQSGDYLGEDDIIRLDDQYGRK